MKKNIFLLALQRIVALWCGTASDRKLERNMNIYASLLIFNTTYMEFLEMRYKFLVVY